ncbi:MAG TPA: right-handed parallel beta-helix repeat-containing protein [Clostridia bacterium]|nr:right-handed parallel beta-helix repeat-containing protein [Clostridia bacterium]
MRSGTSEAPIVFAAYNDERVTISSADLVEDWRYWSNGIYTASVEWDLGNGYNQVFVDEAMVPQARYPNYGSGDLLHPATVGLNVEKGNPNVVTSGAWSSRPVNYWSGAWFSGVAGERWSWQCARVRSSSGNTITLDDTTKSSRWFLGGGGGFLWGLLKFLDADNEWHLQPGEGNHTLYLRVAGMENPAGRVVEMKRREWCVDVHGRDYITVRGLRLRGGAVRLKGNGNVLENCQARFLSHFLTFKSGYSYNGGRASGGGVVLDGTNNTVRGCTIFDTAGSGIISSGAGNMIFRNSIHNTDYSGTYACAIRLNGTRDQVAFNTAHTSGRDILQPGGAGHSICYNNFYNPGQMCRDLGVIYIWGVNAQLPTGQRTRIAYNWIHDHFASGGASPLVYLDNWCRNFVVDHNVIWNSANDTGIRVNGPAAGHRIYNNTLFNCKDIGANTYNMWPANNPDPAFWTRNIYEYSSINNLYLGAAPQTQLQNWTGRDFRPRPGSPAVNVGKLIPGYTEASVNAPDKGAYELGGRHWTAGVNGVDRTQPAFTVTRPVTGIISSPALGVLNPASIDSSPPPALSLTRSGVNAVILTAPPEAARFQLYTTTNLIPPVTWVPVLEPPTVSDTHWSITLPAPADEIRVYRLQPK